MILSQHFIDRWIERVKTPVPCPADIEGMMNDAVFLQRCRDFFTPRGIRVRVLALYWVAHENIILKIDEKKNVAVTVLTPNMINDELT